MITASGPPCRGQVCADTPFAVEEVVRVIGCRADRVRPLLQGPAIFTGNHVLYIAPEGQHEPCIEELQATNNYVSRQATLALALEYLKENQVCSLAYPEMWD